MKVFLDEKLTNSDFSACIETAAAEVFFLNAKQKVYES